jgi:hypothetical protein
MHAAFTLENNVTAVSDTTLNALQPASIKDTSQPWAGELAPHVTRLGQRSLHVPFGPAASPHDTAYPPQLLRVNVSGPWMALHSSLIIARLLNTRWIVCTRPSKHPDPAWTKGPSPEGHPKARIWIHRYQFSYCQRRPR